MLTVVISIEARDDTHAAMRQVMVGEYGDMQRFAASKACVQKLSLSEGGLPRPAVVSVLVEPCPCYTRTPLCKVA